MAKTIRLHGVSHEITTPYKAGKIDLTAGEAHALNQTRAENIGNLCRPKTKDMTEDEAFSYVKNLDESYKFGVSAGRVTDPVVRQMAIVAATWAKAELKAGGMVHDMPAIKFKAVQIMTDREDIVRERAAKIVALLDEDAGLVE